MADERVAYKWLIVVGVTVAVCGVLFDVAHSKARRAEPISVTVDLDLVDIRDDDVALRVAVKKSDDGGWFEVRSRGGGWRRLPLLRSGEEHAWHLDYGAVADAEYADPGNDRGGR